MSAAEQTEAIQEQQEPVKVKRYKFFLDNRTMSDPFGVKECEPEVSENGDFVSFEDYLAAKLNPNGFVLTKDDSAVYRMMQAILDITGDCEQNPTFSGWQLQAVQNKETGDFLKIELIATDKIGDVVAPRI